MSVIILNQAIVHYEALGRGRPVVFLHGWVGSWRYWVSSMQAASTSYRAYALDLYGYGDTTHDRSSYTIDAQADLLERFLDELGVGKVAIVGHGLGAWVAFVFAARQPERVAKIMAVGAPLDSAAIDDRLRTGSPEALVDWLSDRTTNSLEALADASKCDSSAAGASISSFNAEGVFARLGDSNTPCLLAYGEDDPAVAIPDGDRTLTLGPFVHQVQLDRSGHFPMLEAPDRFNRVVTDFLALEPGVSPRELQFKQEWRRRVR